MQSSKIIDYFPELPAEQLDLLEHYKKLLLESNEQLNLISRKDTDNIEIHHLLHSLAIAKFHQFKIGQRILDVGTGGGLPGIPLAILYPDTHFTLIDAIEKKIKIVQIIVEELKLKNVTVMHGRVEKLKQQFDFSVSRAVTQLPKLMAWTRKLLDSSKNEYGLIMLKGGNIHAEISPLTYPFKITPVSNYFKEDFFKEKYIVSLINFK